MRLDMAGVVVLALILFFVFRAVMGSVNVRRAQRAEAESRARRDEADASDRAQPRPPPADPDVIDVEVIEKR